MRPPRGGQWFLAFIVMPCMAAAAQAASPEKQKTPSAAEPVVPLTGPRLVGFFPAVTQREIDKDQGLSEGLNHLKWAMDDTLKCLRQSGIKAEAQIIFGRSFVVMRDGKRKRITPPGSQPEEIGVYLLSPGKEPVAITAAVGPSALIMMVPDAAAGFFGAPACKERWNK